MLSPMPGERGDVKVTITEFVPLLMAVPVLPEYKQTITNYSVMMTYIHHGGGALGTIRKVSVNGVVRSGKGPRGQDLKLTLKDGPV